MRYYRCGNCGVITHEDDIDYFHFKSDYCFEYPALKGKPICPECGCGDLTALNRCDMCGEPCEDTKHELCATCTYKAKDVAEYAQRAWMMDLHPLICLLDDYEGDTKRN